MNYYPFHIGDYLTATKHLSWEEDAAYRRLLDVYYTHEKPLPKDPRAICRLVLATTDSQREAVRIVLEEFFVSTAGGWVNRRAEAELINMRERREMARDKANKRWHPAPKEHVAHADSSEPALPGHGETDATASKASSVAMQPIPVPIPRPRPAVSARAGAVGDFLGSPEDVPRDTLGGQYESRYRILASQFTLAMSEAGIADTTPSHPRLQVLMASGATIDEFVEAAKKAVAAGKGFAYALAIVERERKDAAAMAGQLHTGPLPARSTPQGESFRERDQRRAAEIGAQWSPRIAAAAPGQPIEHPATSSTWSPRMPLPLQAVHRIR